MPLTRPQILDELAYLATIEHALVVDYLLINAALGADTGEEGHPGTAAAQMAQGMAEDEMRHLKRINQALAAAGRVPTAERAVHVVLASGAPAPVGGYTLEQLATFAAREAAIAEEVDRRWGAVTTAVAALGAEMDDIVLFLGAAPDHRGAVAALVAPLEPLAPADYLRVTRTVPYDEFEAQVLALSDRYYQTIVATLAPALAHEDLGGLLQQSVTVMFMLQSVNRELARRGILPAFRS